VTAEALIEGETTGLDTYLDVPVGSVSFNSNSGGIELELANGETIKFTQVREIK
jgi:hypothetical protein